MSNGQKDIRKSRYQEEGYQESRVSDYWMLDAGFRLRRINPPKELADKPRYSDAEFLFGGPWLNGLRLCLPEPVAA